MKMNTKMVANECWPNVEAEGVDHVEVGIKELDEDTLGNVILKKSLHASHDYVEEEPICNDIGEGGSHITQIDLSDDDNKVIPNTQCEDAQAILHYLVLPSSQHEPSIQGSWHCLRFLQLLIRGKELVNPLIAQYQSWWCPISTLPSWRRKHWGRLRLKMQEQREKGNAIDEGEAN